MLLPGSFRKPVAVLSVTFYIVTCQCLSLTLAPVGDVVGNVLPVLHKSRSEPQAVGAEFKPMEKSFAVVAV